MPPPLALLLCAIAVLWLWWRDVRNNPTLSAALWIPIAWFSIIGSRFPSEWFSTDLSRTADALVEGSPLDRNVFLFLLVIGIAVLIRRQVKWGLVIRTNPWIAAFFIYTLVSILWSDFPFTAFKRWHKVFGHVVMALIVWTERDTARAVASLLRRSGYFLILVSILFIKYFPELGRGYSAWEFEVMITGVTTNKNLLGNLCLIVGLFFVSAMWVRGEAGARASTAGTAGAPTDFYIDAVMVVLTFWVLQMSNSATSLVCLLVGSGVVVMTQSPGIARQFSPLLIGTAVVLGGLQVSMNLKDVVIESLGRDVTLTGRTELWDVLHQFQTSFLFGVGFESFWLGERIDKLWAMYWWKPNQAHNGYYETYLNIGAVGLFLQCAMMLACYRQARQKMVALLASGSTRTVGFAVARFSMAYLIVLAMYNMTEATFKALHLSFFVFFLVTTQYALPTSSFAEAPAPSTDADRPRPLSRWSPRPAAAATAPVATPRFGTRSGDRDKAREIRI
jgi:exopolysaccharide production protein ExoQ